MAKVEALSLAPTHSFSKTQQNKLELLAGLGVRGDAHMGETVKHRSRVKQDPSQPNLRQVHLIHGELHDYLKDKGFVIKAGDMGENITTRGLYLLALPRGTKLRLGKTAVIEVTGLRNPCSQLNDFQPGLLEAVLDKDGQGKLVRLAGIMAIVLKGGHVFPQDDIALELPPEPHERLERV